MRRDASQWTAITLQRQTVLQQVYSADRLVHQVEIEHYFHSLSPASHLISSLILSTSSSLFIRFSDFIYVRISIRMKCGEQHMEARRCVTRISPNIVCLEHLYGHVTLREGSLKQDGLYRNFG